MKNRNDTQKSLMDLVAQDTRLTKFNQLVKLAGLSGHLAEKEDLTLFAPTNEAFARAAQDKLAELTRPENREVLKKLVLLHVMPRALTVDELRPIALLRSAAGYNVNVKVSPELEEVRLGTAKAALPKINAKNGYLYQTDQLLRPVTPAAVEAKGSA